MEKKSFVLLLALIVFVSGCTDGITSERTILLRRTTFVNNGSGLPGNCTIGDIAVNNGTLWICGQDIFQNISDTRWSISGSKYIINVSDVLDINESRLNTTISYQTNQKASIGEAVCSGSDKLSNVTLTNDTLIFDCTADLNTPDTRWLLNTTDLVNISGLLSLNRSTPFFTFDDTNISFLNESMQEGQIWYFDRAIQEDAKIHFRGMLENDTYFFYNSTNQTLWLVVNGALQQSWGASSTIFQNFTVLATSFLQDVFLVNAGGQFVNLNASLNVSFNTTSGLFIGNGSGLTEVCLTNGTGCPNSTVLFNTTIGDKEGLPPWLYNDSTTIFFNESYFNLSVQNLSEVKVYVDEVNISVSGGTGMGQSSSLINFEITKIDVSGSGSFRFEAVESGDGSVIDEDRKAHVNTWIIEKSYAINDVVNYSITNAVDGNFTVKLTFLDNFRP